jgi:hypothetical protein
MSFPFSKKISLELSEGVWHKSLKDDSFLHQGAALGGSLEYQWQIVEFSNRKIIIEVRSKSVVTIIVVVALAGAIIPGIGLEGFLIYALIASVIMYYLLFSIISSSIYSFLSRFIYHNNSVDQIPCENCCPACGAKISEDDVFCPSCGLRLKQNKYTKSLDVSKYKNVNTRPNIRYHFRGKNEENRSK